MAQPRPTLNIIINDSIHTILYIHNIHFSTQSKLSACHDLLTSFV